MGKQRNICRRSALKGWITGGLSFFIMISAAVAMPAHSPFRIQIETWSPYFLPATAEVKVGRLVQWVNPTATHHTITHDGCKQNGQCAFDSGSIPPNEVFEIPDLAPGRYSYHCVLHPIMRGVLVVTHSQGSSDI